MNLFENYALFFDNVADITKSYDKN